MGQTDILTCVFALYGTVGNFNFLYTWSTREWCNLFGRTPNCRDSRINHMFRNALVWWKWKPLSMLGQHTDHHSREQRLLFHSSSGKKLSDSLHGSQRPRAHICVGGNNNPTPTTFFHVSFLTAGICFYVSVKRDGCPRCTVISGNVLLSNVRAPGSLVYVKSANTASYNKCLHWSQYMPLVRVRMGTT